MNELVNNERNVMSVCLGGPNGFFAASGHMVHAGGQASHWDIQNKATSSR